MISLGAPNSIGSNTEYKESMPIKDLLKDDPDIYKIVEDGYKKNKLQESVYKVMEDTYNKWRKQEPSWFIYPFNEEALLEFDTVFKETCNKRLELTKKPPVKFKYKPIITENTKEITGILFGTVHPEYKIYNKVRWNNFVTHFDEPYYKY